MANKLSKESEKNINELIAAALILNDEGRQALITTAQVMSHLNVLGYDFTKRKSS